MTDSVQDASIFGRSGAPSLLLSALTALSLLLGAEVLFRVGGLESRFAAETRHSALPVALERGEWGSDVAFLGDSRTLHGVDPEVIARAAHDADVAARGAENLGLPGLSPIGFLALSGYLVRRERPPKLVVLGLSPYMLSTLQGPVYAEEIRDFVFRIPDLSAALAAGMPVEDALTVVTHEGLHTVRYRRRVIEWVLDWHAPGPAHSLGEHGFEHAGRSTADLQRRAARQRAAVGTARVLGPEAVIDWTQVGYLRAAVRELHDAGVAIRFVTAPTSSAIWPYYRDDTLYGPAMRVYGRVAASVDQTVVDDREVAPVEDWYFADGDHLSPEGAIRHSAQLAQAVVLPALGVPAHDVTRLTPVEVSPGCEVVFDFEELHPTGWTSSGTAFSPVATTGTRARQAPVVGGVGYGLVNSATAADADRAVGTARSPLFRLTRPWLRLLVGGGNGPTVGVRVKRGATVVKHAEGNRAEHLLPVEWDLHELVGNSLRIEIFDNGRGPWQHILLDQVEQCDERLPVAPAEPAVNGSGR